MTVNHKPFPNRETTGTMGWVKTGSYHWDGDGLILVLACGQMTTRESAFRHFITVWIYTTQSCISASIIKMSISQTMRCTQNIKYVNIWDLPQTNNQICTHLWARPNKVSQVLCYQNAMSIMSLYAWSTDPGGLRPLAGSHVRSQVELCNNANAITRGGGNCNH